jgi:hypothetical protein
MYTSHDVMIFKRTTVLSDARLIMGEVNITAMKMRLT